MALKPEDPSGGFQHGNVVAFINEKMAIHEKGPEFYLENVSLSWAEVEDKLRAILEDSTMPGEAKEACTWGSLALGVRFARRQGQLNACRVQWLHDFSKLHKSAAHALASNLKELTEQQETERKEMAYRLQLTQAKMEVVQKERDLLRQKLLQTLEVPREQKRIEEGPGLATAPGAGTEGAGEEEDEGTAATTDTAWGAAGEGRREKDAAATITATAGGAAGEERQKDAEGAEAAKELSGAPTPSAPAAAFAEEAPSQSSLQRESSDVRSRSDVGAQGKDPEELQRDRRDADPQQQRRPLVFRRPGDWECPWCNVVNFSRRKICFRCGRGIWMQKP